MPVTWHCGDVAGQHRKSEFHNDRYADFAGLLLHEKEILILFKGGA